MKIGLADSHVLFTEGLKFIFQNNGDDFEILWQQSSKTALIDMVKQATPDLLVCDLFIGGEALNETFQFLKKTYPELIIIVVSGYDQPKLIRKAFHSGADGYLLKSSDPADLFKAIRTIGEGERFIGKNVYLADHQKNQVASSYNEEDPILMNHNISFREYEIIRLLSKGLTTKEIASELYISQQTVQAHRKKMMKKLNVSNAVGLIMKAKELKIV